MPNILEITILIALPILIHYIIPICVLTTRPYNYFGIVLMMSGLILSVWSEREFRKIGTSHKLHGDSSDIATAGPYRFSRNPMYLAVVAWTIGLAVMLGSLGAFLFSIFIFGVVNFLVIPFEEKSMTLVYGEQYTNYSKHVRRWI